MTIQSAHGAGDDVVHNLAEQRFESAVGGELAVAEYQMRGKRMVFTHTEVPAAYQGRGIGSRLARAGLEYARANGLRVVPLCPFIKAYIKRYPEFEGLTSGRW